MAVEDRLDGRHIGVFGAHTDQRAAATHRLGVDVRVIVGRAGTHQGTDQPTGCRAGRRADGERCEPARGHHWAETRDRQHAEAGQ